MLGTACFAVRTAADGEAAGRNINDVTKVIILEGKPTKFGSVPCVFHLRDGSSVSRILYIHIYIYIYIYCSVKNFSIFRYQLCGQLPLQVIW
jgi:hypothetical protein